MLRPRPGGKEVVHTSYGLAGSGPAGCSLSSWVILSKEAKVFLVYESGLYKIKLSWITMILPRIVHIYPNLFANARLQRRCRSEEEELKNQIIGRQTKPFRYNKNENVPFALRPGSKTPRIRSSFLSIKRIWKKKAATMMTLELLIPFNPTACPC